MLTKKFDNENKKPITLFYINIIIETILRMNTLKNRNRLSNKAIPGFKPYILKLNGRIVGKNVRIIIK